VSNENMPALGTMIGDLTGHTVNSIRTADTVELDEI